ncbi:ABC transporter permease [Microbacterium profundi]|uniref:ABC transporter permease n=1 Tax=Microbacterium profundi TaxID=450380 RepID=UPI0019D2527D|nr:ABC transporter permease [Microbacterium profundi]MCE7483233.1 ABC transporter permease [Microbacterium profundi]
MTTTAAPAMRSQTGSSYRLTFPRALRSEWIKLSTLRSTWWSIGIAAVLTVGIAVLVAGAVNTPGFEPIQAVVTPFQFTMLLAGIIGAIAVTGEYSTGMIRSTLAADPVRGSVLAAKAIVVAVFLFVASFVIFILAAVAVMPIFASRDVAFPGDDVAGALLPILGASVSMSVFALIGVAFGFLLRSGAGAIAATVGLLFVLPIIASIFAMPVEGWEWITEVSNRLPMTAAQSAILPQDGFGLSVGEAYLTLAAWVAAGMLSAWAVLRTRDA